MRRYESLSSAERNRFSALAAELAARVDEIAEQAVIRIRADAPQFAVDTPELSEALASGSRPSILAELVAMQEGARIPASCPDVDAEGARLAARFGVPLQTAIWVYRVGHRVQWQAWYRLVGKAVPDAALRVALHEAGSDFFFDYADTISAWVTEEYTDERDRLLRGHEQRRISVVRELLAGSEPDPGPLDYPLTADHVGVVASGEEAPKAIADLARALDRRQLTLHVEDDAWWGWLGCTHQSTGSTAKQAARLQLPHGVVIALGSEAHGVEGFRRTHKEALATHRIARVRGPGMTAYESVELEVIALEDPVRARAFVERELGEVAGAGTRPGKLRETLVAYFANGHNAAATAEALGVHEQTVGNRLAGAERLIGTAPAGRRAELELALRLFDLLDDLAPAG